VSGTLSIAACELRRLLYSPLPWVWFAALQGLLALLFFRNVSGYMQFGLGDGFTATVVGTYFSSAGVLLLLSSPLVCASALAEEQRSGTIALLLSSPVSLPAIVLGKYLGMLGMIACLGILLLPAPLAMLPFVRLEPGLMALYLASFLLLAATLAALGLYCSSLAARPAVAAVTALALILLAWATGLTQRLAESWFSEAAAYLNPMGHYTRLLGGLVEVADVAYFPLTTAVLLALTVRRLHSMRLLH